MIYQQRNELLETDDITETLDAMRADVVGGYVNQAFRRKVSKSNGTPPALNARWRPSCS